MPHFKIETSLFEPVTIEVEGGRTYESAPLSPSMLKAIDKLENQKQDGTLDSFTAVVQQIALIFGLEPKDIEPIDIRILNRILENVSVVLLAGKQAKIATVETPSNPAELDAIAPPAEAPGVTEVEVEKNAPKPGDGISQ